MTAAGVSSPAELQEAPGQEQGCEPLLGSCLVEVSPHDMTQAAPGPGQTQISPISIPCPGARTASSAVAVA